MVRLNWFVRQKVLGAHIHETEGLLERNIAVIPVAPASMGYPLSVSSETLPSKGCPGGGHGFDPRPRPQGMATLSV